MAVSPSSSSTCDIQAPPPDWVHAGSGSGLPAASSHQAITRERPSTGSAGRIFVEPCTTRAGTWGGAPAAKRMAHQRAGAPDAAYGPSRMSSACARAGSLL